MKYFKFKQQFPSYILTQNIIMTFGVIQKQLGLGFGLFLTPLGNVQPSLPFIEPTYFLRSLNLSWNFVNFIENDIQLFSTCIFLALDFLKGLMTIYGMTGENITLKIMSYLDYETLVTARMVSKTWVCFIYKPSIF